MRIGLILSFSLAVQGAVGRTCITRPLSGSSTQNTDPTSSTTSLSRIPTSSQSDTTTTTFNSDIATTTTATGTSNTVNTVTVTATSANPSASTATTSSEDGTTIDSASTGTSSVQTDTTSSELPVSTTTTGATTTSDAAFQPIATFDVVAIGASINGEYLEGLQQPGYITGWRVTNSGVRLSFSIDSVTKYVEESSGLYWCVEYNPPNEAAYVALCDIAYLPFPQFGFLTCEQEADGKLQCSVPAKTCVSNGEGDPECSSIAGTFANFYAQSGSNPSMNILLTITSPSNPVDNTIYKPVDLGYRLRQS